MNEVRQKGLYSILYKLSKRATWLFLFLSVLALAYTYWRAQILYNGEANSFYLKFYVISILGILFWGIALRLKDGTRLVLITVSISLLIGLYFVEGFLHFTSFSSNFKPSSQIAEEKGIPYDKRSKLEVINDLKKEGVDAVSAFWPFKLIKLKGVSGSNGETLFPINGISNKTTVLCNETGEYAIYDSDRFGFNNPDSEWGKNQTDWLLIGDSFVHGNCVNPKSTIAGQIRQKNHGSVLSLGSGGNGPLIELATLKEYGESKKPKRVIWVYCHNDLFNLIQEQDVPTLKNYMKQGFSQNLINRQPEINSFLSNYLIEQAKEDAADKNVGNKDKGERYFTKFLRLYHLRDRLGINVVNTNILGLPSDVTPLFRDILVEARNRVSEWGGKFYFVYLPTLLDYKDHQKRQNIIDLVKPLDIPVIDIYQEVFESHPNPIELFPFEQENHYTEIGYRLVSNAIFEGVGKSP